MGTADGNSSRLMSQRPGSSDGGRKAGGAQRVRSALSRQGIPRRSTGSSRSARTSTYWRFASAATCWAIIDFGGPGRSPDNAGLAGFDQECERAGELGRAQGVVGGDGVGNGHGQGSEWQGIGADALPGHPAFAPPAAPSPLSAVRGTRPERLGPAVRRRSGDRRGGARKAGAAGRAADMDAVEPGV